MKRLRHFLSIFQVAVLRLWNHRGLMACAAAGLITAVALSVGIPLYADAEYYHLLHQRVETEADARYSPFSFLIVYDGDWSGE